ncbi:ABC transporter permease [Marinobacter santoriniensis NKSG1]|uniref:ABC transporter permease n=1 Tax=Marinobacter santoriniensis NKSG1 TaxID=1288826 RepID=M7DGD2_9GAMM|nr:MlaE family lipid ABC transporter permease subunit [Marinobacter santoriniensis]EMP56737.1 ABC transporter permease [Marinobacter santoriniensis NKSG1]
MQHGSARQETSVPPNTTPGNVTFNRGALAITGDWTLPAYQAIEQQLSRLPLHSRKPDTLDLANLGRIDTAGASLLADFLGPDRLEGFVENDPVLERDTAALLRIVARSLGQWKEPDIAEAPILSRWLSHIGERVESLGLLLWQLLGFMGQTLATLFSVLPHPGRWRVTAFVAAVQDTGLNALPIVALLTFLVGAVVAFLGATVLEDFGATIYTVNLVAFSFLREFGVLLAAILLAGRTASSFTAHIGAMKVNEELDAIRTLGLNPVELLVLPRVLAMMVSLPILTFVGMIAGMVGGALVCVLSLDISLGQFLAIVERDIALRHFLVGLSKAPVLAFLIAVIGCLEGFKVGGSAQSVGEHTTSSVVQSIFTVILLDAIAALFFMEMGW